MEKRAVIDPKVTPDIDHVLDDVEVCSNSEKIDKLDNDFTKKASVAITEQASNETDNQDK